MVKKIELALDIPRFVFGTTLKEDDNRHEILRKLKLECLGSLIIMMGREASTPIENNPHSFFKITEYEEDE